MPVSQRYDLLVIGLGPVGLVLAGLARIHGLSVIAIDRDIGAFPLPRAAVFDSEIMRVFQMLGVAERLAGLCRVPDRYQFLSARREILLDFPVPESTTDGWAGTYVMHQPAVEQLLRQRLSDLGVSIRNQCSVTALAQDDEGVIATVHERHVTDGIAARYAVGCDGASSRVRTLCGVELYDYGFDEPWLVLDAFVEPRDSLPQVCQQICDPARPVTHLAMNGNRFRWEFMLKTGENPEAITTPDSIHALLAPWSANKSITIERQAVYRFHALIAMRWRTNRVLLAGDAAHQMPPFAGQGMCSGIRDAVNLAWKIALVCRGAANEAVLDTYQAEREPHVRAIIETAIAMGRVVCLQDEQGAKDRDTQMLARRRDGNVDISIQYPPLSGGLVSKTHGAGAFVPQPIVAGRRFDELLGLNPVLIGHGLDELKIPGLDVLDLDTALVAAFAPSLGAWLANHGVEAALIRPDRCVYAMGAPRGISEAWQADLTVAPG